MSRSGDTSEAFGGPFIYTIVLLLLTSLFFTNSPIGVVAATQMAVGDGVADLIGRRLGKTKWWFDDKKSYAGSIAFTIAGFFTSWALLEWFYMSGALTDSVQDLPARLLLISATCALVEVLPIKLVDDNWSVPLAAAGLSTLLL